MSITVIRDVFDRSAAEGPVLLVLLALAEAVNEAKVQRGEPAEAWPSQETIAAKVNLSPRAVRRHLKGLLELGELRQVGKVGRGCIVYEITLPDARTGVSGVDRSVRGESEATDDPGQKCPGGRTDLVGPRTDPAGVPRTGVSAEPEGEHGTNGNRNGSESGADAPDVSVPATELPGTEKSTTAPGAGARARALPPPPRLVDHQEELAEWEKTLPTMSPEDAAAVEAGRMAELRAKIDALHSDDLVRHLANSSLAVVA
jgi:hypothetical protein